MGVTPSSLQRDADASNNQNKQVMNDALNSLQAMAKVKMDDFYSQVENTASDSLLLPIKRITGKFYFIQAKAAVDSTKLQGQIRTLIGDLAGGHWADAIAETATDIVSDLLGASNASIEERQSYMITMNPLGGIQRLDAYYFAYSFTSSTLVTEVQNVVACMAVKSSADCRDVDDNTLRVIVNDSFPSLSRTQVTELYEQLASIVLPSPPTAAQIAATTALENVYAAMDASTPPPATPAAPAGHAS